MGGQPHVACAARPASLRPRNLDPLLHPAVGAEPAKRRPGYANFAITEPPLKLVLLEGEPDCPTVMDHLGVEVDTTTEVNDATTRLDELGLFTQVENDTTCCYARQDKVWVHGPGHEPWEVYTVKDDSQVYGHDGVLAQPAGSCATADDRATCCSETSATTTSP